MKIKIKTFARVRELCGFDDKELTVSEGITIKEVVRHLKKSHQAFADYNGPLLYAINEEYRPEETTLTDGDTLAILPPVSGG